MEQNYCLRSILDINYKELFNKELIKSKFINKYRNKGVYSIPKFLGIYWTDLFVLCNYDTDEIVGSISIRYKLNYKTLKIEPWLYNGIIWSKKRGLGLSKILFNCCFDIARKKGYRYLFLVVRQDNFIALSLYRKLGFNIIEKKGDNHIMEYHLNNL